MTLQLSVRINLCNLDKEHVNYVVHKVLGYCSCNDKRTFFRAKSQNLPLCLITTVINLPETTLLFCIYFHTHDSSQMLSTSAYFSCSRM